MRTGQQGSEPQPIRLTCRECGAVRAATRHYIQDAIRVRAPGRITVDWERGEAIHTCRTCTQRAKMQAANQAIIKRSGRQGLAKTRGQYLATWKAEHPEEHQAIGRTLAARRKAAPRSALATARLALGHLRLSLNGVLGLCVLCHRLVYTEAANAKLVGQRGRAHVGRFHGACYRDWHQSDIMRAWVSACRRAGVRGEPKPEMPAPPRPATRMSSAEELAEGYAATVHYFWQKERSGPVQRDERGDVPSVTWLANDLGITRDGLRRRVERFLNLLPEEAVASGRVKMWRTIFLTLKTSSESADSNTLHSAHPPEPNTPQVAHP